MDVITWLRKVLNEPIPAGGTEADTFFTNAELTAMLEAHGGNKYFAAAEGWTMKAAAIQTEGLQAYTVGNEHYTYADKDKQYRQAMELSQFYRKQGRGTFGAFAVEDETPAAYSELMGGKYNAEVKLPKP